MVERPGWFSSAVAWCGSPKAPRCAGDMGTCHLPPLRPPLFGVSVLVFPAGFGALRAETPRGRRSTGSGGLAGSSRRSQAMGQPRSWRGCWRSRSLPFTWELRGTRGTSVTPATATLNENLQSSPATAKRALAISCSFCFLPCKILMQLLLRHFNLC